MIPGLVREEEVESRRYQEEIYRETRESNSLVVLPTGLGKTVVAAYVVAHRLQKGRIMFMAPTKPLCEQHADLLRRILETRDQDIRLVTGETHNPEERKQEWNRDHQVYVATPQTVQNDLDNSGLEDFSLLVFDEAHRAVGSYAYTAVSDNYHEQATDPQTLGLTASPGNDFQRLVEVGVNLRLQNVSIRTEFSDDVENYTGDLQFQWREIEKTGPVIDAEKQIDQLMETFLDDLSNYSKQAKNLEPGKVPKTALIEIQNRFQGRLKTGGGGYLYHAISLAAAAVKLAHLKDLLTSQGPEAAQRYIQTLQDEDSKASSKVVDTDEYREVKQILETGVENRKLVEAKRLLERHFSRDGGPAIVFAEYRDTVDFLVEELGKIGAVDAERFVGQAGEGMTQQEQKERLESFRSGDFNTLVSTSIGEEGIDVPEASLVLFYEPVPSTIRLIQRRGRTARDGRRGRAVILMTKDSRDEAAYWKSLKGESGMYQKVRRLKETLESGQDLRKMLNSFKKHEQADLSRF